jgi:hypothetical protein
MPAAGTFRFFFARLPEPSVSPPFFSCTVCEVTAGIGGQTARMGFKDMLVFVKVRAAFF